MSCHEKDQKHSNHDAQIQFMKPMDSRSSDLPEPLNINSLKNEDWLETTSGIVRKSESAHLCVSGDSIGFFGFYTLIDKKLQQRIGIIKIHTTEQIWRKESPNERFAEIKLSSNKIAVWDSIKVGTHEASLMNFIKDRFYYRKDDMIYSVLDDYEGIFLLSNDTITEMTIRNNCQEKAFVNHTSEESFE